MVCSVKPLAFALLLLPYVAEAADTAPAMVILVRHAEKVIEPKSDDPLLTPAGEKRANELARVLERAGVTAIYATEYKRTQLTVAPLAKKLGKQSVAYSSKDAKAIAKKLREAHGGEVVVVAAHSNTIPDILKELGVKNPPSLGDDEYGDLFVVALSGANARFSRLRYGD